MIKTRENLKKERAEQRTIQSFPKFDKLYYIHEIIKLSCTLRTDNWYVNIQIFTVKEQQKTL